MLESIPVTIAIGAMLGFLAGLGVGGGSLLILWLTLVIGMDHHAARIVNLLFFIPTAVISSIFRWKQGRLCFSRILPAVIAGCICAGIFSYLGRHMDLTVLKKLFGLLLLATGIRELFYRPNNQRRRKAK